MPIKICRIFDFDQTITRKHTFGMAGDYQTGGDNADTNKKEGIEELLLHNDSEHLSAIATYHNNPAFIAGFVAKILGQELTLIEKISFDDPSTDLNGTAIDIYSVNGTTTPFLISYINKPMNEHSFTYSTLHTQGKNSQIRALRDIFLQKGQLEENSVVDFYDDDNNNYDRANELNLPYLSCNLVDKYKPKFTITKRQACPNSENGAETTLLPSAGSSTKPKSPTTATHGAAEPASPIENDVFTTDIPPFTLPAIDMHPMIRRRSSRTSSSGQSTDSAPQSPKKSVSFVAADSAPQEPQSSTRNKIPTSLQPAIKEPPKSTTEKRVSPPTTPKPTDETLRRSLERLRTIQLTKDYALIEPHIFKLVKQIERLMGHEPADKLLHAVQQTYKLLKEPNQVTLIEYRGIANTMLGKPKKELQTLGAIMFALGAALAIILAAAVSASLLAVTASAIAPLAVASATSLVLGGYSFFSGCEKGPYAAMNQIANGEEVRRRTCN